MLHRIAALSLQSTSARIILVPATAPECDKVFPWKDEGVLVYRQPHQSVTKFPLGRTKVFSCRSREGCRKQRVASTSFIRWGIILPSHLFVRHCRYNVGCPEAQL